MNELLLRKIKIEDNEAVADLIRDVLSEFGANKPGFAAADPETDRMYETYQKSGTAYWVIEQKGKIVGGAGVGKLKGYTDACELQKMYIQKSLRGLGMGKKLMEECLQFAQERYRAIYIETFYDMEPAKKLYERYGFAYLSEPIGNTGHFGCDIYMAKYLKNE